MSSHENRFDSEALTWDSKPEVVQSSQSFFGTLLKRVPQLQKDGSEWEVLDLGCGTGLVSERLCGCKGVKKVFGLDSSKGMIDMFNAKRGKVENGEKMEGHVALLEDPEDPILKGQKFDLAIMHLTLHHIPRMAPTVKVLAGVLKPSQTSCVALSDFENDGDHALLFHPKSKHQDVERHGLTMEEMQDILQQAQLTNIKVDRSFRLPKTIEGGQVDDFSFLLGVGHASK